MNRVFESPPSPQGSVAEQSAVSLDPFERPKSLIHELFEEQVAQRPHALAVVCEQESMTYAVLNDRANRLASYLRAHGVGPDRLVGVCLERGVSMVVGLLAVLKAGGAYVPIDPAYPADRVSYMLEDAAPCVMLTQEGLRSQLPAGGMLVVTLDGDWDAISTHSCENPSANELSLRPEHLAYVIYTSGSTGRPKGVMIEHASVVNFLRSMQKRPGISATDRLLAVTTIAFDIAALEIYLPLVSGAAVVLTGGRAAADAHYLAALLHKYDISVMQATPATWRLLLHGGWTGRNGLKILCGGEALTADLSANLVRMAESVWNMYGPTETTIWSCARRVDASEREQLIEPVGDPIDNTSVYILDENLKPVPSTIIGEIYIGGAGVARGYLYRLELTAERFLSDPFSTEPRARMYKTGDLGRWRQDGAIEYVGRADHQVKVRGFRIELGEIEVQLARHPDVREAVVVALVDAKGEKRLVAYVVPRNLAAAPTVEALRAHLADILPEYMVPSVFIALECLPLTPNGKIDRRALPEPDSVSRMRRSYGAPQGKTEETVAAIWQALLHVERVGRNDNFFELGGYSMLALDLRSRIAGELGVEISLSALIEAPTVAQLTRLIEGRIPPDSLVLIRAGKGGPAVFLIHDGDGETLLYRNLALRLDRRHAVFGVNPYTLPGVPIAHTRIADMATYYIEKVRSVQPSGPYVLGGMCAGGVIAYEMALQLRAQQEHVGLVVLLDAAAPGAVLKPWRLAKERLERVAGELRREQSVSTARRIAIVAGSFAVKLRNFAAYQVGRSWRQLRDDVRVRLLRAWLDGGRQPPRFLGQVSATTAYLYAEREYRPDRQLQEADLVLFRATRGDGVDAPFTAFYEDPLLGWAPRCLRPVRAVDVPGGHTSMLQEPHVNVLAKRVQEAIDDSLDKT